ncbi:adenylosuccinate lyase [Nanoarchaeota archaeon]
MTNPNILSQRYVTEEMNDIFSERGKAIAERELWIAVMKSQRELGVNIPAEDIEKFERAKENVDLEEIERIEKVTKHDIKAKIESFVKTAGAGQYLHKGMTSRDLSDNVEQMQLKNASELIFGRFIATLRHFADRAKDYGDITLTARTHHQAAKPTLLGRRFSMWAEELSNPLVEFQEFTESYPLRGIKGPIGTQDDMLDILGSREKVEVLEKRIADHLGFRKTLDSPGQVYFRSLDYALLSRLATLSAACENFGKGMRLMAGYELVTEGFKEGQVGSSAMPHKMNTRSSERICGFSELLKMYSDGASRLSGDQWEEGDVSCSVIRRVILPDSFYSADGLCETTMTVLNEMGAYPAMIDKELQRYLPFLASTKFITAGTEKGLGREKAHEVIKEHAVAEVLRMRKEGSDENHLAELLANDPVFAKAGVSQEEIERILDDKASFIGNAKKQIDAVCNKIGWLFTNSYEELAKYEPKEIL